MTLRICVVGDSLLDVDVLTSAQRLSPDGPAPVLQLVGRRERAGGAGLAANLLAADGDVEVSLVTPLAGDGPGEQLLAALDDRVRVVALPTDEETVVKTRVRCGAQTVARIDAGPTTPVTFDPGTQAAEVIERADAILVADYGRGVTSEETVRGWLARRARRPIVWDPHPRGGAPVRGSTLVTPNAPEAAQATGLPVADGVVTASRQAAMLREAWRVGAVSITLGAGGAVIALGERTPAVVPAPARLDGDTCGAGDAFAAAATLALARGALPSEAVQAAVSAATQFVAAGGVATLGSDRTQGLGGDDVVARVRAAGGTVVATGGCFDLIHAGHIATLAAARALGDCLVVCLNSDASVRRLKGPERPLQSEQDRARVLESFRDVDAVVVFDEDTPEAVLRRLKPDIWVKGGDYSAGELPEAALVRSWGGEVVCVPYLSGRSTTGLVTRART